MQHLLTLFDWSEEDIRETIALAEDLKKEAANGLRRPALERRMLAQVYDKPSLRTRVSFETAMAQLGGSFTFMTSQEAGWAGRESLPDVARVLGSFADGIVIRTFSQELVEQVAEHAACPVINGLTDEYHPAQALTDLLTIKESLGSYDGVKLAFVGDGNNVARSLAVVCGRLGVRMTLCAPQPHLFQDGFLKRLSEAGLADQFRQTDSLSDAVRDADVIYTDVWASMGQESEKETRRQLFAPYQIDERVIAEAPSHTIFLHCLPAHRGEEVTDGVIDGTRSRAFEQAENRMHLAKGLLTKLMA